MPLLGIIFVERCPQKGIKFILILCGGTGSQGSPVASDINRQFRQAEVMLKSAVIFTKRKLYFHVIADSVKLFSRLVNITSPWPERYKNKVKFIMHDVWYPTVSNIYSRGETWSSPPP